MIINNNVEEKKTTTRSKQWNKLPVFNYMLYLYKCTYRAYSVSEGTGLGRHAIDTAATASDDTQIGI